MSNPKSQNQGDVPTEVKELLEMGAAGKLWTLEIEYALGNERKISRLRNLTEAEMYAKRKKMFAEGLNMPVGGDPGHWKVVCPLDIISVDLYRQTGYFSG